MSAAWHICRRDLRAAFAQPLAWLVLAAWTALTGGTTAYMLMSLHGTTGADAPLYLNAMFFGAFFLTLLAPALTMNTWAAERAQGTHQLLLTLPIRDFDLALGKFLGAWITLLSLLAATLVLPAALFVVSRIEPLHLLACYLGLALFAAALAGIGTWVAVLVDSPVAAYVITFAIVAVLWLVGTFGNDGLPGMISGVIGLGPRVLPFLAGELRLASGLWLLAVAGSCLLLAHGVLAAQRAAADGWWRRLGMVGGRTLAGIAALVVLVAAADRANWLIDCSPDRRFSVDPALTQILRKQTEPVELVAIWTDEEAGAFNLTTINQALQRITTVSPATVHLRRIDPDRHRPLLADFAANHHGEGQHPSVYAVRGERLVRLPMHGAARLTLQRDLAGAVLTLANHDPTTVYLMQGHGELRPNGGLDDGLDSLHTALVATGFDVRTADAGAPPPSPHDVVAICGPTVALGPIALGRLDDHLRDGGGLLVMADDRAPTDLMLWLRRRGVLASGAIPVALEQRGDTSTLFDPAAPIMPARYLISLLHYVIGSERGRSSQNLLLRGENNINPHNELTSPLVAGGLQLVSPFSIGVEALPLAQSQALAQQYSKTGMPPFVADYLLNTMPGDVWERRRGEPLIEPQGLDKAEPRTLAWRLEYAPVADSANAGKGGRLIVWGSRQAASDAVTGQLEFANAQFLAAGTAWLARHEPPPNVPPAEVAVFQVTTSDGGVQITGILLAIVIPMLCIGAAMLAWWDGRR